METSKKKAAVQKFKMVSLQAGSHPNYDGTGVSVMIRLDGKIGVGKKLFTLRKKDEKLEMKYGSAGVRLCLAMIEILEKAENFECSEGLKLLVERAVKEKKEKKIYEKDFKEKFWFSVSTYE